MELLQLRPGEVQLVSPAKIQSLMTGVHYCTYNQRKELLTLFYSDGTKESATISKENFKNENSFLGLVDFVQSKRKQEDAL